jgi:cell division septation protein DedD
MEGRVGMAKTYYVIELTPRWLAATVVAMAALVVVAFALGYGAGSSVGGDDADRVADRSGVATTPTVAEVAVAAPQEKTIVPSVATPMPMEPTLTPPPGWRPSVATPTAVASTPTAAPPTVTPRAASPTPARVTTEFWVQVLASGNRGNIASARTTLEENGFPRDNQSVVQARVAGGNVLYKLRVGPFPDRASADRVMVRMQRSGFPDAWVVSP